MNGILANAVEWGVKVLHVDGNAFININPCIVTEGKVLVSVFHDGSCLTFKQM